jgi:hypothetical protein
MSAWEERLKKLINPTENKWPYRVVQVKPNRKQDNEIYSLSGREEDIAANGSLFLALYDLAERDRIDFDEWFTQWELGFPLLNAYRELGNYQLVGNTPWRDFNKRPRFRDWTPPELKNLGYRTIEYWRDRSDESKSVVLSGLPADLIRHIIQLEYTGKGATSEESNEIIGGGEIKRRGKPQIKIYFKEDEEEVEPGYQPIKSEITFRLMGKTDTTISKADLNQYKAKIENIFATQGGKIWRRGKDLATYTDWENGYQIQMLVRSKSDAEELAKAFLDVQDVQYRSEFMFYKENLNPVVAYPTNPGKQTILGKEIIKHRRRPITQIRFQWASLSLPSLSKPIYLIDLSGSKKVFDQP